MILLHTGDLHIGKRIHEKSLLEDQVFILNQIIDIAVKEKADALLISGDVYDKPVPSENAVKVFDEFLSKLHKAHIKVFIISGNHDSGERIGYGSRMLRDSEIYICGVYKHPLEKVTLEDEYGPVNIYMLPYIKPAFVRQFYEEADTYEHAVEACIKHGDIDYSQRNILIAHQFITYNGETPNRCESENISVGAVDNVDGSIFQGFDYVALGHLHRSQRIGKPYIRYSGSPLKYSFSEVNHVKSITKINLLDEGEIDISAIPLVPLRDMIVIKGTLSSIIDPSTYSKYDREAYIRVVLTDEKDLFEPLVELRKIFPNTLRLDFENSRTLLVNSDYTEANDIENKDTMTLFDEFYLRMNGVELCDEQRCVLSKLLKEEPKDETY